MRIDVIDFYKNEFDKAYLSKSKDNRKRVSLFGKNGKSRYISYARYLWQKNFGEIPEGYEVDHINNDKTDDRIENLQLLSKKDNTLKARSLKQKRYIKMICPICGKEFDFERRNLSTRPNPCCSKQCGYKKGVLTKKLVK